MAARPRPEVVAPAGDFACVRAAVENGADAVYFGVRKFNARARARNFTLEELPGLMADLRRRGVRGYAALNTLVFSNELDEIRKLLKTVIAAGPDAIILQDPGLARLARDISPDVPLYASTQTTTTSAGQMDFLREIGFSRVILARELSLDQIRAIKAATDMPLGVFVHGALCVAYSGQCLTSEALGGRSGNRGACAQACRLPYEMIVDGHRRDLGDRRHLLSPLDLAAYDLVPQLADLVVSLKIEGRLKKPEYVAAAVRAYRKVVDTGAALTREEVLSLRQVFSRGFSHGFLDGIDHQKLVDGRSPKKRGIRLGRVASVQGVRVQMTLEGPLRPGDGIVFDPDETGGRVINLWRRNQRTESADAPDTVTFEVGGHPGAQIGWTVWKTDDPALNRSLRATFEKTGARVSVDAVVEESAGNLKITLTDGTHLAQGETGPLQVARSRPLTADYLREHLGRMGNTPFTLRNLDMKLGNVMVPVSMINDLRRRLTEDLEHQRRSRTPWTLRPSAIRPPSARTESDTRLVVLCRTLDQVNAALEGRVDTIECELNDAVPLAHDKGVRLLLAPPRIFKPGETGFLRAILAAEPDGVLARSTAHIAFFRKEAPSLTLVGDFSLNVANELTADWYFEKGLSRLVPSYDLNWEQLQAFLDRVDPGRIEVTVHQHMPMFHTEHCVMAACLSTGKDRASCGRPCEGHEVRLRDRAGMEHPVRADAGCRNTVYNAVPQSASPYLRGMLDRGVRWFRVELLGHTADDARRLIRSYRDVIEGRADGQSLWQELRASNFMGVTRGPLGREE